MTSLVSRMFRATGFLGGRMMLRKFDRSSRNAVAANRKTLMKILKANAEVEFGRRHGFGDLATDPTARRFRDTVPLSTHADYSDAIARMEQGETDVLTADELLFFAVSSGTTGAT